MNQEYQSENLQIKSQWLGLIDYQSALDKQKSCFTELAQYSKQEYILGCEHQDVITLGKRAQIDVDVLRGNPLPLMQIDRGGQATLHSRGQLVIYPIVNLNQRGWGARHFVEKLQTTSLLFLKDFGIDASLKKEAPGLYTTAGKIGFVGVRIQKGISTHGVSINVRNDLDLFKWIRSCGVQHARLDKMEKEFNTISSYSLKDLFNHWTQIFLKF